MRPSPTAVLLALLAVASAHGDHEETASGDGDATYAEMHMASEARPPPTPDDRPQLTTLSPQQHHLDNFDIQAFFHLHDLNRPVSPSSLPS